MRRVFNSFVMAEIYQVIASQKFYWELLKDVMTLVNDDAIVIVLFEVERFRGATSRHHALKHGGASGELSVWNLGGARGGGACGLVGEVDRLLR